MNLEAIQGLDIILMYRFKEDEMNEVGKKLAFQTDFDISISADKNDTPTRDGNVSTVSNPTTEISCESLLARNDPMVEKMRKSVGKNKLMNVWEIDLKNKNKKGEYKATVYECLLSSFDRSFPMDEAVSLSLEFGVNGDGIDGWETLSDEQEEFVREYITTAEQNENTGGGE